VYTGSSRKTNVGDNVSNKTPYEIRLELIQEARLILQAKAGKADLMPSTEEVITEAEKLNSFISKKPDQK
jgi:hypothetical protein